MNKLTLVKWHIYAEFILILFSALTSILAFQSPIIKLLIPKDVILIYGTLLYILTGWLGFLAYIIHKFMKNNPEAKI